MCTLPRDRVVRSVRRKRFVLGAMLVALSIGASLVITPIAFVVRERVTNVGAPLTADPHGPLQLATIITSPFLYMALPLVPVVAVGSFAFLVFMWTRESCTADDGQPGSSPTLLTEVVAIICAEIWPVLALLAAYHPDPAINIEYARQQHAVQKWAHARYGLTLDDASARQVVDAQQPTATWLKSEKPQQDVIVSTVRTSDSTPRSVIFRCRDGKWMVIEDPDAAHELPTKF